MVTMEEYEEETRRGKLQLIRDILLSLELEGRPMKPTLLMYSVRLNWTAMRGIVEQMNQKQLVDVSRPERSRRGKQLDRRSNARISPTLKGKYVLRILDEMLRYLEDETPPAVNPPLWLMRKALQLKGFDFMGELKEMQSLNLLEAPSLLEDPTPFGAYVENPGEDAIPLKPASLTLDDAGEVLISITEAQPSPPIRDYRPYSGAKELAALFFVVNHAGGDLAAGFEVKGTYVPGSVHCPECGRPFWGLKALNTHVGRMHKEKKREIIAALNQFRRASP